MKTNYHTHTYRCKHARGEEKDYVLNAIEKNVSILGFSDHSPFENNKYDTSTRMDFSELKDYISIVNNLKETYKDKINIKCGLEIEYNNNEHKYYEKLLNEYKVDYLVLGQHFFANKNNKLINTYAINDSLHYIEYAKTIVNAIKTGYFKFLAHPDVIFVNDISWDKNCENCCDLIINVAKENDFILEFNANGLRRGKHTFCDGTRYSYPYKKFWDKVAKENIKVIINSDCHTHEQVWDNYMNKAYNLAKSWGLNIINEIF